MLGTQTTCLRAAFRRAQSIVGMTDAGGTLVAVEPVADLALLRLRLRLHIELPTPSPSRSGRWYVKVLICGAGIAGLTLALCLRGAITRRSCSSRLGAAFRGLYVIDFFASGVDAIEQLDLRPMLERLHRPVSRLVNVDRTRTRAAFRLLPTLRRKLFADRHYNFTRGALELALLDELKSRVEVRVLLVPYSDLAQLSRNRDVCDAFDSNRARRSPAIGRGRRCRSLTCASWSSGPRSSSDGCSDSTRPRRCSRARSTSRSRRRS